MHAEGQTSVPADVFAPPATVVVSPSLTSALRAHLVEMWARVTNEGGSVGFVAPVTVHDIRPTADRSFARVAAGSDALVCLVIPERNAAENAKIDPPWSPQRHENGHRAGPGNTADDLSSPVSSELAAGDRVVAWLLLAESESHLRRHWRTVYRVQVDPAHQGAGLGRALMAAAARYAKENLGLEALTLMTRGGTGAERFYQRCGYREVGRIPGAIRVGPGDDRDELHFWLTL